MVEYQLLFNAVKRYKELMNEYCAFKGDKGDMRTIKGRQLNEDLHAIRMHIFDLVEEIEKCQKQRSDAEI